MAASNQYSLGDYIILNSPKPLPELKRLRVECRRAGAFEATRHRVMPHGVPPGAACSRCWNRPAPEGIAYHSDAVNAVA